MIGLCHAHSLIGKLALYAEECGPYGPLIQVGPMRGMLFFPASNTVTGLKRGVIIGLDVQIIFSKENKGHLIRFRALLIREH